MIRVLHCVSNMDRAGIETILMNYYRNIDRTKVQFDFLCNKQKPGAYDEEIKKLGGRIFITPGLNPVKYLSYYKYMKKLFSEHSEYRTIEAHNGALGEYALFAAKHSGIPNRIFHAHGASIAKDIKLPLKLFCKKMLKKSTTHNFACGTAAAECYFGKGADFTLIPNAIEEEKFIFNNEARKKLRKKYSLENMQVIGHIGRFMVQKNHAFLLEIFAEICKKMPCTRLVLLGEGELMASARKKAVALGIEDKVMFMGNLPNANEWYSAFDVFVLPSFWEGLPVVGIEAQAADLPCVFSDTITKETVFTDNAEFLSLQSSAEVWAEHIIDRLQNKDRKDKSIAVKNGGYSIKTASKKLTELYLEING